MGMRAFLLLISLLLTACAAAPGGRPMSNITWRASDINGVPLVAGSLVTLQLTGGNRVAGSAGCNRYSGSYKWLTRMGIDFDALGTTRMACAADVMDQERRFLSILENVEGYIFYSDGGLSLIAPDGRAVRFRR
jgi:heat shock protein HslJ